MELGFRVFRLRVANGQGSLDRDLARTLQGFRRFYCLAFLIQSSTGSIVGLSKPVLFEAVGIRIVS